MIAEILELLLVKIFTLSLKIIISVGGEGQRGCSPPSWAEIRFTRANVLKGQ